MTRRRKRLGAIGGGWRRKPRDVEPGRFEPDTRHFSIKKETTMPRPKEQHRLKLESLKPGEWHSFGPFTPELSARVRDMLRDGKRAGSINARVRVFRSPERNLLAVYTPEVPWWASADRKVGGRVVSLPSA